MGDGRKISQGMSTNQEDYSNTPVWALILNIFLLIFQPNFYPKGEIT